MALLQKPFAMADSLPSSPSSKPNPPPPSQPQKSTSFLDTLTNPRAQRQLGLFAAGAGFFLLSTAITRRSIVRRYKATIPKFYAPSNRPSGNINGAMEAFEALNIATINVLSVGMMASGGLLWAFDIAGVEDMRRKVRKQIGVDVSRTDQDAEEEIEEWFATVLARKEFKALRGSEGVKEMEERQRRKREEKESGQEK
jgi:hypothetical protein